jgi:hypothetical protein
MATKGGNRDESGNTKIRFIMLEAEGNATDLQQIAQAITSAVRPTTIIQQIPAPPAMHAMLGNAAPQATTDDLNLQPSVEFVDEAMQVAPLPKKSSGNGVKRKLPVPSVLELDLTSGTMPFAQYFQQKSPDSHSGRYLVIAAWLKEHRQIDEIGIDHIYTCYRTMNLNVVRDVGSIFRSCKQQGWFNAASERGQFAINHVGLGQVNNMNGSG